MIDLRRELIATLFIHYMSRSRSRSSRSLSLRSETPSTASEVATSRGTEREALQPLAVNSTVSQGSAGKLKKGTTVQAI